MPPSQRLRWRHRTAVILSAQSRSTSISSPSSVVKKSSSMNSEPGIWGTLIHREAAEVNGGPTRLDDQQFGSSGDLSIDHCSLSIDGNVDWQAIETRTNGTASSNATSQMVWSAAYINAAILQDTYSGGVIQSNSRLYFEQDANWDTTAVVGLVSGNWQVVQRYVYSPYGSITVLNADWSTPPACTQPMVSNLYQGMTLDSATGLYYERNRNYSPGLGTWISQDPLQYINGANTYQFAMSNPVGFIDPYGSVASATGTVTPSTTPGSAPGSGTASATATTGPVNTGISGVSVSGSTTGTLNTNGSYSGAVTATATAKLSNGISASLSATASSFGKLNKNPAIPTLQEQIQAAIMAQLTKNSSLSFICKYQPTNHNYSIGPQSVVSG